MSNQIVRALFFDLSHLTTFVAAIFTVFLFVYVLPPFLGMPVFVAQAGVTQIIMKAYVEMVVMGLILVGFMSNAGFVASCRAMFPGSARLGDEAQKPESSG